MRTLLVLFMIVVSLHSMGQNNTFKVSITNCFSNVGYSYQYDTISVTGKIFAGGDTLIPFIYKFRLTNKDSIRFMKIVESFIRVPEDEIFSNECVRDGFHFKIFIRAGSKTKKIYVNNSYEIRTDSITSIFNSYFSEPWLKDYLILNGMGYWNEKEYITELIDDQKKCMHQLTKEDKQFYIERFCEL